MRAARRRVLQVVLSLRPGGTERLVVQLVQRLRAEIPMAICCLDEPGDWADELRSQGVPITALQREAGFNPALARRIARFAAETDSTILHCHQYSPFVYGALARLWAPSLKVIFTEHGRLSDAGPSRKRRVANAVLSHLPAMTFTVSGELKGHLVAEGFAPDRVGVIYNGIEPGPVPDQQIRAGTRAVLGIQDKTLVIGTVARLDSVKDLGSLIRAIARLNRTHPATLLVIGDGDERARLERDAYEADGGASTRFLGHRDDARALLAGCDLYANSSISEGISLTILEAMAAGLPVVATSVGGTPEVADESCARLVPARDVDALAGAIAELSASPDLRAELGRRGRKRVEARFTLDRMVAEYRDAYLRAAD